MLLAQGFGVNSVKEPPKLLPKNILSEIFYTQSLIKEGKVNKFIISAGLLMISPISLAQDSLPLSFGAGIGIWDYDETKAPAFSPRSLEFVASYRLFPNLDVRGNIGLGVGDDSEIDSSLNNWELKIKNHADLYIAPNVSFGNHSLYALVGYSKTRIESAFNGMTSKDTSDGMTIGAGFSLGFNKKSSLALEWRMQADTYAYELSGLSLSYVHAFD